MRAPGGHPRSANCCPGAACDRFLVLCDELSLPLLRRSFSASPRTRRSGVESRLALRHSTSICASSVFLKALSPGSCWLQNRPASFLGVRPGPLRTFLRVLPCCAKEHFKQTPVELLPVAFPRKSIISFSSQTSNKAIRSLNRQKLENSQKEILNPPKRKGSDSKPLGLTLLSLGAWNNYPISSQS